MSPPPRVVGQSAEFFRCPEGTYAFTGSPEQTLCEQYSDFTCEIQIGAGTPFPKSSDLGSTSLSGNVCVVGDFEVDNLFTFQNAVVKIHPGVTISVAAASSSQTVGGWLVLNSCKLFACNGLWKGITLGFLSSIFTYNSTRIEDAEKAVYASGFCALYIAQTTFNRNRIGIELHTLFFNLGVPGPILIGFGDNRFTCTAPLNGTTDEITEAGVKLSNANLVAYWSTLNRFSDLKYGIYSEGISSIHTSRLYMQRIRKDGIYMKKGGSIFLRDSWFYFFGEKGINIEQASLVDIGNTRFEVGSAPTDKRRIGIHIPAFALNARVLMDSVYFHADLEGTENRATGIHLGSKNVSAEAKIKITNSDFGIRGKDSHGIFLDGTFSSVSETNILKNWFRISHTTQGPFDRLPTGIKAGGGNKSNLLITQDTFASYEANTPPSDIHQWNIGLCLLNSVGGTNNEVSENMFIENPQTLLYGLLASFFSNTKYCSNTFRGFYYGTGAAFNGPCAGTDFIENTLDFSGFEALLITEGPVGVQSHKGNRWYNLFDIEPLFHALYLGDYPTNNRFVVHTPQSTCAIRNDTCFNPFHPRKIHPDTMDEFFIQDPTGTPSEGCAGQFAAGGTDELDRRIAQGVLALPPDNPSLGWVLQRYLYQKLKDNSAFISEHPSFPVFMTAMESTTVGGFYEVHAAIENALKTDADVSAGSAQALLEIGELAEEIAAVDEAIEQQGLTEALKAQKESLILQLRSRQWVYDSLRSIYEAEVAADLQTAYDLNEAITTTHAYETNEKTVNKIRLLSLMQQGGELTDEQVATLQAIAQQEPRQGGPAVHTALGMLAECAKPEVPPAYSAARHNDRYAHYVQMAEERRRSSVAAVEEVSEWSLWPNPASLSFTVGNPRRYAGVLTLLDVSGRVWLQQSFSEPEIRVDLKAGLPAGVYVVRLEMADGTFAFKKLIVRPN